MTQGIGKVFLVGAGPGGVEYLTQQAIQILREADVLLYDALADDTLLTLVPSTCDCQAVGKRGGQPSLPQATINERLVAQCQAGRQVVRLKSGDPFIFGRSQAEIQALQAAQCPYEVVPGLSSALVAPLLAGIPLTDPDYSQNFAVLTGHNPAAQDWAALARLDTLVILMGARQLEDIVARLLAAGRSPTTAIAILKWAGRPTQTHWYGTLATILAQTAQAELSPCIIVIGAVVHHYGQDLRRPRTEQGA